jgi:ribosome-binding protein aMBF1 (putative translation factor)
LLSWRAVPKAKDYRVILGATPFLTEGRAGFSQEQLAEKADLHPNYLGRVERGEEQVSLAALVRIARALGVRVKDLVAEI